MVAEEWMVDRIYSFGFWGYYDTPRTEVRGIFFMRKNSGVSVDNSSASCYQGYGNDPDYI
jgi:hypothetical protein